MCMGYGHAAQGIGARARIARQVDLTCSDEMTGGAAQHIRAAHAPPHLPRAAYSLLLHIYVTFTAPRVLPARTASHCRASPHTRYAHGSARIAPRCLRRADSGGTAAGFCGRINKLPAHAPRIVAAFAPAGAVVGDRRISTNVLTAVATPPSRRSPLQSGRASAHASSIFQVLIIAAPPSCWRANLRSRSWLAHLSYGGRALVGISAPRRCVARYHIVNNASHAGGNALAEPVNVGKAGDV